MLCSEEAYYSMEVPYVGKGVSTGERERELDLGGVRELRGERGTYVFFFLYSFLKII